MRYAMGEIVIARPLDEVFAFVADEGNEPRYHPDMVSSAKVTDGPIGLGTRFAAGIRPSHRRVSMLTEYTAFERSSLIAFSRTMPRATVHQTLRFEPVAAGTRMRWTCTVRPAGLFRVIGPIIVRDCAR